jgi:hypothetical protein
MRSSRKVLGLALLSLVGGALVASACSDSDNPLDSACTIATAISDGVGTVTYTASRTGNGTISSYTYNTDGGPVTVTDPALPYSLTVTLETAHAGAAAIGTASNGSITIGWQIASEVSPEQDTVTCAHSSD